eukprot:c42280_g1_i1 orf=170-361(-)
MPHFCEALQVDVIFSMSDFVGKKNTKLYSKKTHRIILSTNYKEEKGGQIAIIINTATNFPPHS